ncbi:amino acid permease [Flavihumibacter profundi]|uniref:amino acid permease n=1 Tax=Flavihumibacter profundi TaxID=2716883 RepID=UPI001CC5C85B|nr:amino acid permease [Flavihumibacter profundi]MBZ5857716.1 amino acid permease [Flavihumibacter profundi]
MKESPVTDNKDLARFGYRQELQRSMGSFSSFAAGFSYISILTGLFQMFHLGYGVAGPGFFWTWPFVLVGQFLVALCFAELASRFPLSGGVYQWAKYTGNPFLGWMTGWIYLACLVTTIAAVAMALQVSLPQISNSFQVIGTLHDPKSVAINAIVLGSVLIVISTIVNARGIKLLALINNIGVFAELIGIVLLIVLLFLNRVRSPIEAVVHVKNMGPALTSFPDLKTLLAATALTASYVLYGFDTAGTLAEETHDPRKKAPRAILQALLAAGFAGLLVLLFALMAVPDLGMPDLGDISGGLPMLVKTVLGETAGSLFLCVVIFAIIVCTLAVHSGAVRLLFAMGRDGCLPYSKSLSHVSPGTHTPVLATLLCGLGAIIILAINLQFPKVFELVTSIAILWANLAYWIVVALLLKNRFTLAGNGADTEAKFSLGKWGLPVNILALIWSSFMVINVSWPRTATYGFEWYQQYAAWIYTAGLIALGVIIYYYRLNKRQRIL